MILSTLWTSTWNAAEIKTNSDPDQAHKKGEYPRSDKECCVIIHNYKIYKDKTNRMIRHQIQLAQEVVVTSSRT